ncbi:hypothetical protein C1645_827446 [Glomus cerebriforme]|uniref:C2H2-type domain-containing protein n=1 Tax=Glomus cerebriforme TaxID=658196 RepID=A0A397SXN0_9GLOM|nr:hypothetical protein C1645_827446 [Glomus cerebriforme]
MVNQTNQTTKHTCKWGTCTDKFDSMLSLWKHVEQQHVDNATPRLIHLVNDDDDIPVTSPQKTMTKSSINFVATSQMNQSHVYPAHMATGVIRNGVDNVNNGQNMNLMAPNLNTQQSRLQPAYLLNPQISPTLSYDQLANTQVFQQTAIVSSQKQQQQFPLAISSTNYLTLPQFQQIAVGTQSTSFLIQPRPQQQQQQIIQSAGQASMVPLGSMPNPITIDDNTMDVDPPVISVNHQRLGRPPVPPVQGQITNLNRQSLSQSTKK